MANPTLEMVHGLLYGKGLRIGKPSGTARLIAALTGDHADVVPFMGPQSHDHCMTVARVPARRYYWDAELLVNVQLAVQRWYGFDSYTIIPDAYNFEVEALGAKMIYSDNAMPTVDVSDPLIKSPADLDRIGPLDPTKGRIPMAVEVGRLTIQKAPGPLSSGFFCSPWSLLCQAMGYPKAVRALKRDRAYAQALFQWAEDRAIFPFLRAYARAGVKAMNGADAWAAFPNLTPELVQEWVLPSAERLAARAKKELGVTANAALAACDYCEEDPAKFDKAMLFKCLDTAPKLAGLSMAFVGMGRTQDLDMRWLQEYAVSRGKGGHKVPIMASLNGRFIRDSSPDEIVAKIREWIDIMGRDGRLILFIGNIPADTPPLNIHTAVQAVRTLGRYPIAANLESVRVETPAFQPFDEWLKGQPEAEVILRARQGK
jgi:uroporphyrinogen-III decarboxylase